MGLRLFCVFSILVPLVLGMSVVTVTPSRPSNSISVYDFEQEFSNEFLKYFDTKVISPRLNDLKRIILDKRSKIHLDELPNATKPKTCLTCRAVSYSFLKYNATVSNEENKLAAVALSLCNFLSLAPWKVCPGMVEAATPTVNYILRNSSEIDADRVCSIYFQMQNCAETDRLANQFPINYPIPEAPVESKKASVSVATDETKLILVHLSDFHFDPHYTPGSDARCVEGICCRGDQGFPNNTLDAAGFWGDYRFCDTPWHSVEDLVKRVKQEYPRIDLIYYTGDIVDHFYWKTSIEYNSASIKKLTNYFKKEFPNIPIYPVLGNHEGHPSNSIAPSYAEGDNISSQWMFDLIHSEWEQWLPASALETLKLGGYYTAIVRPNLRLIALNNNYCYHSNIWLIHSTDYFADQLEWFRSTLATAAENGERVHIISHVPTSEMNCFVGWAREYRKIVEEFSSTIVAIFNGHTHEDEFNVHYSIKDPSKAIGVAFNGGSGTTFGSFNPNFKTHFMDPTSYEVLDYDEWHYNLTEANLNPNRPPQWQKTYSFKDAYGLTDLSPDSMDGLVKRLATDKDLFRTYWERKEKYSDYFLDIEKCNDHCMRTHFCGIVTMVHGDDRKCDELYPPKG